MPVQYLTDHLASIANKQNVLTDREELTRYCRDQSICQDHSFDILVKPGCTEEIASILKLCNTYKIPVTPRGGGTGVTGGAIPLKGGIVMSLERLNRILAVNEPDGYVIAEAGVVTADLCHRVEQSGLYFPVIPTSYHHSFIGGNVAQNSGSINSCKYGTISKYVLNLQIVLPDGEIIWTGASVGKNATGLNLTQLFVGSEGTLGIIAKVVLRLLKKPTHEAFLLAGFNSLSDACKAVNAIKQSNLVPSGVELICQNALDITSSRLQEQYPLINPAIRAHLLVQLDGHSKAELEYSIGGITDILKCHATEAPLMACTDAERIVLSRLRHSIGNALKSNPHGYRDIDICMPVSRLYEYIVEVESICATYDVPLVCFGHALDGNVHAMLLAKEEITPDEQSGFNKAVNDIYLYALGKGGVISGEHGIGLLQKQFMKHQYSEGHLALMKGIKHLFDANSILNPGKMF